MEPVRDYLFFYNATQCVGWAWLLQRFLTSLLLHSGENFYASIRIPLLFFQTAGVLEVLHSLVGLVRSSPLTTALQLGSRLFLVWPISESVPEVRSTLAFKLMVLAWSLTEIPRYFYFAVCAHVNYPPAWLVWVRYSTFFPLYPLGATSEWFCVLHALPYISQRALYNVSMPNPLNFEFNFYYFCVWSLAMYVPGLAFMYFHMIHQRKKNLAKLKRVKAE